MINLSPFTYCFWFATHKLGFWFFHLLFSYRCGGRGNLPNVGPALLVSNHQSFLDPYYTGLCSRRPLKYLARHNLFKSKILAWFLNQYGAFPIDRDLGKEGLQTVFAKLAAGHVVTVFVEGERTHDGRLQDLKPGIALLVKRSNAPIVPCGIVGSYESWPRQRKLPCPAPLFLPLAPGAVAVAFGEAIPAGYYRTWSRDAILADLNTRIAAAMAVAARLQRKR